MSERRETYRLLWREEGDCVERRRSEDGVTRVVERVVERRILLGPVRAMRRVQLRQSIFVFNSDVAAMGWFCGGGGGDDAAICCR